MNSFWPVASRISCLRPRTLHLTCQKVDSCAVRLARTFTCPYSTSRLPIQQLLCRLSGRTKLGRISQRSQCQPQRSRYASARIPTTYDEVPKNYSDEEGLRFRERPLSQVETTAIFGKGIRAETANTLLAVLHGRRVAGTLEDPKYAYNASSLEARAKKVGLAWLRKHVPVDEIECAARRAIDELRLMEEEVLKDSYRLGIYKPSEEYLKTKGQNVYEGSVLDALRAAKEKELDEKERLAREKEKSQADEVRENTGPLAEVSATSSVELRRPGENPRLKYYLERAKILPDTPPEMTMFQRLWPSALVVLGVLGSSYMLTQVYVPPSVHARLWPDMPPAAATIISIIILNSLVFVAWRIPPLFRTLNKYFINVPGYPFAFSLVGQIFSHQAFSHFTINMVILWFVGTRLHDEIGRANFLAIYMSTGALAGFTSLTYWVVKNSFVTSSLGASGALSGIIATYLWLNRSSNVKIVGTENWEGWPSIPAAALLAFFIAVDLFGLSRFSKRTARLDHPAHLGGFVSGIACAELLKLEARRRREMEMERRRGLGVVDRVKERRL